MLLQVSNLGEGVIADFTLKWPDTSMLPEMIFKITALFKLFIAPINKAYVIQVGFMGF